MFLYLWVRGWLKQGELSYFRPSDVMWGFERQDYIEWIRQDITARKLGEPQHWQLTKTMSIANEATVVSSDVTPKITIAKWPKEVDFLYPYSEYQSDYWLGVLQRFISVSVNDTVPLLLINSTSSQKIKELLQNALSDLGNTPIQKDYHSRQAHLISIYKNNKKPYLIDFVDTWPEWQTISQISGVNVTPVLETLPLDHLHILQKKATDIVEDDFVELDEQQDIQSDDVEDDLGDSNKIDTLVPKAQASILHLCKITQHTSQLLQLLPVYFEQYLLPKNGVLTIDSRLQKSIKDNKFITLKDIELCNLDESQKATINMALTQLKGIERQEVTSSGTKELTKFLKAYWGYEAFKESQQAAIKKIALYNSNVLTVLPTGEGKSVLFQVPALYRGLHTRRLTVVVSPLRALMKDQVNGLINKGFSLSVDYLSADRSDSDLDDVFQGVLNNRIVLLYIAPERFRSPRFQNVLKTRIANDEGLEFIVFDEAHCISQWGYDFRPDYFYAVDYLAHYAQNAAFKTPCLMFSATVTEQSAAHLKKLVPQKQLPFEHIKPPTPQPIAEFIDIKSFPIDSANNDPQRIEYIKETIHIAEQTTEKTEQWSSLLVFVNSRLLSEEVAQKLTKEVDYYHAGRVAEQLTEVYEAFKEQKIRTLIATKAFGMGMDIPHIHAVVHLTPPSYLEDYLQEVGRIGRGEPERNKANLTKLPAILLHSLDNNQRNLTNELLAKLMT